MRFLALTAVIASGVAFSVATSHMASATTPRVINKAPDATVNQPSAAQERAVPAASEPKSAAPAEGAKQGQSAIPTKAPDVSEKAENPDKSEKSDSPATEKAAAAKAPPAPPTLVAKIDLTNQQMVVTANGKTVHTWAISSGAEGYETPTGSFRPSRTEEMWYSTQYDDAPMPHSVFFNGGIATHATNSTRRLGSPASHGCVRLAPRNAERFYDLVHQHGMKRTRIVVTGKTPASGYATARRSTRGRYAENDDYYDRPSRRERQMRRNYYRDRYGYAPPAPYYAPPRLVYPGDRPRYYSGW